jgi:hypothetical protein
VRSLEISARFERVRPARWRAKRCDDLFLSANRTTESNRRTKKEAARKRPESREETPKEGIRRQSPRRQPRQRRAKCKGRKRKAVAKAKLPTEDGPAIAKLRKLAVGNNPRHLATEDQATSNTFRRTCVL